MFPRSCCWYVLFTGVSITGWAVGGAAVDANPSPLLPTVLTFSHPVAAMRVHMKRVSEGAAEVFGVVLGSGKLFERLFTQGVCLNAILRSF